MSQVLNLIKFIIRNLLWNLITRILETNHFETEILFHVIRTFSYQKVTFRIVRFSIIFNPTSRLTAKYFSLIKIQCYLFLIISFMEIGNSRITKCKKMITILLKLKIVHNKISWKRDTSKEWQLIIWVTRSLKWLSHRLIRQ